MSRTSDQALSRYIEVLSLRTEQAQQRLVQAKAQLQRSQTQLQRLQHMGLQAQLKNSPANVALYMNAAGFRSSLMDMAQQLSDVCSVHRLDLQHAETHMHSALRRQESMHSVMARRQTARLIEQSRQGQKSMDELAAQAWLRQRKATGMHSESC